MREVIWDDSFRARARIRNLRLSLGAGTNRNLLLDFQKRPNCTPTSFALIVCKGFHWVFIRIWRPRLPQISPRDLRPSATFTSRELAHPLWGPPSVAGFWQGDRNFILPAAGCRTHFCSPASDRPSQSSQRLISQRQSASASNKSFVFKDQRNMPESSLGEAGKADQGNSRKPLNLNNLNEK